MKYNKIKGITIKEAREYISELEASKFREGDCVEVELPDWSKQVFVFRENWEDDKTSRYILKPDSRESLE